MQGIFKFFLKKYAVLLFSSIILLSLSAYSQTPGPTQQNLHELLPTVDPTQMTKAGFDSYFKDNNQAAK
jgi:hypothetical protein